MNLMVSFKGNVLEIVNTDGRDLLKKTATSCGRERIRNVWIIRWCEIDRYGESVCVWLTGECVQKGPHPHDSETRRRSLYNYKKQSDQPNERIDDRRLDQQAGPLTCTLGFHQAWQLHRRADELSPSIVKSKWASTVVQQHARNWSSSSSSLLRAYTSHYVCTRHTVISLRDRIVVQCSSVQLAIGKRRQGDAWCIPSATRCQYGGRSCCRAFSS